MTLEKAIALLDSLWLQTENCWHQIESSRQTLREVRAGLKSINTAAIPSVPQVQMHQVVDAAKLVAAVVRTFGSEPFTLDDLCGRIEAQFPEATINRGIISRRLFDLRRRRNAQVSVLDQIGSTGTGRGHSAYRYHYHGPPVLGPQLVRREG